MVSSLHSGWFKFGGVEFFKVQAWKALGDQGAWDNKTAIYLGSAACAEFIADVFLCPLEATRIRLVSDPSFASGLAGGFSRLLKEEGALKGFYSGFGPILMKQVPYTMAKFAVQGAAAEALATASGQELADVKGSKKLIISLTSGVIGVKDYIANALADIAADVGMLLGAVGHLDEVNASESEKEAVMIRKRIAAVQELVAEHECMDYVYNLPQKLEYMDSATPEDEFKKLMEDILNAGHRLHVRPQLHRSPGIAGTRGSSLPATTRSMFGSSGWRRSVSSSGITRAGA